MDESKSRSWLPAMLVVAILYVAASLALSGRSPVAWVIRATVFVLHIGYERGVRRSSVLATASRTTLSVVLAGIALAAYQHWRWGRLGVPRSLLVAAVWPIATALTAFVTALAVASALRAKGASSETS